MTESHTAAAAITASEWRALLGYGELRLSRRRVQLLSDPISTKEANRLFSWAPTTVLGDGNDILVLEFVEEWASTAQKHPAHPSELVVIPLTAVKTHHCVGSPFHAYLSGEAEREQVSLEHGKYDDLWSQWVAEQSAAHELATAQELVALFGLDIDLRRKRSDGYSWLDIIRLAKNSKVSVKPRPKHIESLLKAVRGISTTISGAHDSAAFDIAANIEWIAARTGKDPLKKKALRAQMDSALEDAAQSAWSIQGSEPTADAIKTLQATYPKVYAGDVSPTSVIHVVRVVMAAKDRTLRPLDFVGSVHALRNTSPESAALLCVAVAGALGPLISKRLIRSLQMNNPIELDWDTA
jgi:hypothetical protein